jgi:outer membrane protein OmpA-like peptidoglycan-associated protein
MGRSAVFLAVVAATSSLQCAAQAQGPVLGGKQVTESALIRALEIDGPAMPADGVTRSFGPAAQKSTRRPAADSAGKANLLMTFAVDSAELTPETIAILDTVAKALQSDQLAGFTFKIEGHADPRGSDDLNLKLSELRAAAVVNYLVTRHGILPERLVPIGKGSNELMDTKNPEAAVNRRVTIVTNRG